MPFSGQSDLRGRLAAHASTLNILLVDDDEDDYIIVRSLVSKVEDRRHHLSWVATYEAALASMLANEYDVYLVDYRLGKRDGLSLLREASEKGCRAPMILLTGQGGRHIDVEAMRAGAADYLVKGEIDSSLLERSIRYAVERTRALDTLRKNEERFRNIVEATPVPMVVVRMSDNTILFANDPFLSLVEKSREVLADQKLDVFSLFENGPELVTEIEKCGQLHNREVQGKKADGSPLWMTLSARQIVFEEARAILMGLNDVTEHKRAERELVRLERLRALGEVSAGISHNLNNLLVGILGPAQVMQRKMTDARFLEMVKDIVTSARRARDLVQRLHFAVKGRDESRLQPVSLGQVIQDAIRASRPRWKDEPEARGIAIEVTAEVPDDLPPVCGTRDGLHDILLNLLFNAVDALPSGGRISLRAQVIGEAVELRVSDTGIGMEEETRRRVFDPFFTTKMEVGTGLGLYTVYGSVNRMGGYIEVESAPGKGTRFILYLPLWTEPGGAPENVRNIQQSRRGNILIVDDDSLVLKVLPYLLSEMHSVETASGSQEALKSFEPERYDVVLIDLGMPGMPGNLVAQQMRARDPSVAMVLITGWEIQDTDPRLSAFDFCIQKPFDDLDAITDVVAQAVELHDTRRQEERDRNHL